MDYQKEFELKELPEHMQKDLMDKGFVRKDGKVCMWFLRPSEEVEPTKEEMVEKIRKSVTGVNTEFVLVNKARLEAEHFEGEIRPVLEGKHMEAALSAGLVMKERRPRLPSPKAAVDRLRKVFRDNQANRAQRGVKSGVIDFKRLGRLGITNRVFMRKHRAEMGKEYVVHVALDTSGSMHSQDPKSILSSVGANLVEDLRGLAQVALYVHTEHAICVKQLGESTSKEDCAVYYHALLGYWGLGGNNTFSNVFKLMRQKIREYKNPRAQHLVFFCADGGNCSGATEKGECLRAVKELERVSEIAMVGVLREDLKPADKALQIEDLAQCNYDSTGYHMRFFSSIGEIYSHIAGQVKRKLVRRMA